MKASEMLTAVVNRQIVQGSPVIVEQPLGLWELRGSSIRSNSPVTIRVRAESHYAATKKGARTMMVRDCVLVSR
tara:strand:- start:102 stop:323 length:222 start_codon:yes stop_codon:yes gene_type:complete